MRELDRNQGSLLIQGSVTPWDPIMKMEKFCLGGSKSNSSVSAHGGLTEVTFAAALGWCGVDVASRFPDSPRASQDDEAGSRFPDSPLVVVQPVKVANVPGPEELDPLPFPLPCGQRAIRCSSLSQMRHFMMLPLRSLGFFWRPWPLPEVCDRCPFPLPLRKHWTSSCV